MYFYNLKEAVLSPDGVKFSSRRIFIFFAMKNNFVRQEKITIFVAKIIV